MEVEESEKQYKNRVVETFGSLSIGVFTAALIGSVEWATIALVIFGAIFALCGVYIFVPLNLGQERFLVKVTTKNRMALLKWVGWFIVAVMFAYNLTQTGVTWQIFVGIIFIFLAYVVLYWSIWRGWKRELKKSKDSTIENGEGNKIKKNKISIGKVKWWCSQCKGELESSHTGPCPKCGETQKYCTVVENPIKRAIIRYLDKFAIRSFLQLLIHILIAMGLATLLYFLLTNRVVSSDNFVTIISSIAAVSGALLAVTLAFGTFLSRFATDWRDRILERLHQLREKLELQMELSAHRYPDISLALVDIYQLATFYIPGQTIEQEIIDDAKHKFDNWAMPQFIKSGEEGKTINFGNRAFYDSFEKYLFDAHRLCQDTDFCLTELNLAERFGRSLFTYPPILTTWALVLVYSLVLAFIGSIGVLCAIFYLPILFIPMYLSLFAIIALILDFWASIKSIRGRETGYEMAMTGFSGTSPFIKTDK